MKIPESTYRPGIRRNTEITKGRETTSSDAPAKGQPLLVDRVIDELYKSLLFRLQDTVTRFLVELARQHARDGTASPTPGGAPLPDGPQEGQPGETGNPKGTAARQSAPAGPQRGQPPGFSPEAMTGGERTAAGVAGHLVDAVMARVREYVRTVMGAPTVPAGTSAGIDHAGATLRLAAGLAGADPTPQETVVVTRDGRSISIGFDTAQRHAPVAESEGTAKDTVADRATPTAGGTVPSPGPAPARDPLTPIIVPSTGSPSQASSVPAGETPVATASSQGNALQEPGGDVPRGNGLAESTMGTPVSDRTNPRPDTGSASPSLPNRTGPEMSTEARPGPNEGASPVTNREAGVAGREGKASSPINTPPPASQPGSTYHRQGELNSNLPGAGKGTGQPPATEEAAGAPIHPTNIPPTVAQTGTQQIVSRVARFVLDVNTILEEDGVGIASSSQDTVRTTRESAQQPQALGRTATDSHFGLKGFVAQALARQASLQTGEPIGLIAGKDGLLHLSPSALATALASGREETITILQDVGQRILDRLDYLANPLVGVFAYDRYAIDPRATQKGQKISSREQELTEEQNALEGRLKDLVSLIEQSTVLRDWFRQRTLAAMADGEES